MDRKFALVVKTQKVPHDPIPLLHLRLDALDRLNGKEDDQYVLMCPGCQAV